MIQHVPSSLNGGSPAAQQMSQEPSPLKDPRSADHVPGLVPRRRRPVGAELVGPGWTHFRVWAPRRQRVAVIAGTQKTREVALVPEGNGYFSAAVAAGDGTLYRYR